MIVAVADEPGKEADQWIQVLVIDPRLAAEHVLEVRSVTMKRSPCQLVFIHSGELKSTNLYRNRESLHLEYKDGESEKRFVVIY